ncbi:hypothetical protein BTO30_14285 [Domibacillus antri]|uniref:Transcriptional regulator n=1 Tax=Domibacillus antri TaxID=1714264 RepID=A0A1Q8Q2I7_9BACI|nr:sugar diacid recognition domain-containing protein [Domibacillus antri]OLN21554.1 hypothetical protein BTO30_14285 [Domibacillus antri]
MLTSQLAHQIVEQTMLRLQRNINIMDTNGMILASGEKDRVEQIHEGAAFVAKTGEPLAITNKNKHRWPGSRPGLNLPIRFQNQVVGIIGITGNPNELKEFANLVQLTTEMMVHQSIITSKSEWKKKMKERIFEELISSQPVTPSLLERLSLLGFQTIGPFFMAVADITSSSQEDLADALEQHCGSNSVLSGYSLINQFFILASGITEDEWTKKVTSFQEMLLHRHIVVRMGIGRSADTLEQLPYTYRTARHALQFSDAQKHIIHFHEVELLSLLKTIDSVEAEYFYQRLLGGLSPKLLETLKAYLKFDQQLAACSEHLQIHRHTLTYRLNQIADITGYHPGRFQDAIALQTALWIRS